MTYFKVRERVQDLRAWAHTSAKSKWNGQLDLLKRPIQALFLWIIGVNVVLILTIGLSLIGSFILFKYFLGPVDDRQFEPADWTVFSHHFIHRGTELFATIVPFIVSLVMLKKKRDPAKNARFVMHAQFQLVILLVTMGMVLFGNFYIKRTPFSGFQLFYVNCIIGISSLFAFRQERLVPAEYLNPHLHRFIWKNALANAAYQLTILVLLVLFADKFVLELPSARDPVYTHVPSRHMTLVYCAFELMTLFNMCNCRVLVGLNRGRNILKGLRDEDSSSPNRLFVPIWICLFLLHILGILALIYTLPLNLTQRTIRLFFFSRPLTFAQWKWALALGVSVLVWGQIVMSLPPKAKLMSSNRESRRISGKFELKNGPSSHGSSEKWGKRVQPFPNAAAGGNEAVRLP